MNMGRRDAGRRATAARSTAPTCGQGSTLGNLPRRSDCDPPVATPSARGAAGPCTTSPSTDEACPPNRTTKSCSDRLLDAFDPRRGCDDAKELPPHQPRRSRQQPPARRGARALLTAQTGSRRSRSSTSGGGGGGDDWGYKRSNVALRRPHARGDALPPRQQDRRRRRAVTRDGRRAAIARRGDFLDLSRPTPRATRRRPPTKCALAYLPTRATLGSEYGLASSCGGRRIETVRPDGSAARRRVHQDGVAPRSRLSAPARQAGSIGWRQARAAATRAPATSVARTSPPHLRAPSRGQATTPPRRRSASTARATVDVPLLAAARPSAPSPCSCDTARSARPSRPRGCAAPTSCRCTGRRRSRRRTWRPRTRRRRSDGRAASPLRRRALERERGTVGERLALAARAAATSALDGAAPSPPPMK